MFPVSCDAVRMRPSFAFSDVMNGFRSGNDFAFDIRGQKDFVLPDDRRRMAAPGKRGLPDDVFIHATLDRQFFLFRDAATLRSAPLGPVRSAVTGLSKNVEGANNADGH